MPSARAASVAVEAWDCAVALDVLARVAVEAGRSAATREGDDLEDERRELLDLVDEGVGVCEAVGRDGVVAQGDEGARELGEDER